METHNTITVAVRNHHCVDNTLSSQISLSERVACVSCQNSSAMQVQIEVSVNSVRVSISFKQADEVSECPSCDTSLPNTPRR